MKAPEETTTILAAIDFTEMSANVIQHAATLARLFNKSVTLLHVLDKRSSTVEKNTAQAKLQNYTEETFGRYGKEVLPVLRSGSLYDTIAEVAAEVKATIVVAGTHGISALERFTGTPAFRIVTHVEDIPILIVQDKPLPEQGYKDVVMPFSFTVESRQKLAWAIHLNKIFNCTFHMLAEKESDEFAANKVRNNIAFAQKYLTQHGCSYTVQHSRGQVAFHKEVLIYAEAIKADLIIIMTEEEREFSEYFQASREQNIIANDAGIPVLSLNAVDNMQIVGAAMFQ